MDEQHAQPHSENLLAAGLDQQHVAAMIEQLSTLLSMPTPPLVMRDGSPAMMSTASTQFAPPPSLIRDTGYTHHTGRAAPIPLRIPLSLSAPGVPTWPFELNAEESAKSPHMAHALAELLSQTREAQLSGSKPAHRQLKDQFVYSLLFEQEADEATALRQGQILDIDLRLPRAVILIDAANVILPNYETDEPDMSLQRHAEAVINGIVAFFHLPNDAIIAHIGGGEVVVLKASSSNDLRPWATTEAKSEQTGASWANLNALKRAGAALADHLQRETQVEINVGIGRYHPGILGLARSYQDARAALLLGRHFHPDQRLHCLDALGVAAFIGLSDEQTKVDLARHLLSPLDQESELIETLSVFFAHDCKPSVTADILQIHRNTLLYRLEKVFLLTGLDPRRFDEAMQIRLALLLRSLPVSHTR